MPSDSTRNRLLDAAERIFAEVGYNGASLRTITAEAEVDLGAVRYHFGSKDGLFGEVLQRRLDPLYEARLSRLQEVEAVAAGAAPELEAVIEAFLEPGLRLVRDEQHGRLWLRLVGWARLEPGEYLATVHQRYAELMDRFLAAFARALPELPANELEYRFYFLFVNIDGTLRAMEGLSDLKEAGDDLVDRLIHFVAAGMRAPVAEVRKRTGRDEIPRPPSAGSGLPSPSIF